MLDPLVAIPGPLFLLLFWLATALLILVLGLGLRWDGAGAPTLHQPDPAQLSPQVLAALRGGANAVIRLATYRLWQVGALRLEGEGPRATLRTTPGQVKPEDRVEALVLDACHKDRAPRELFKVLKPTVDGILEPVYRDLVRQGLMKGPDAVARAWNVTLLGVGFLLLVGGTKVVLGIQRHRPVDLLVLSIPLACLLLVAVLKPWRSHPLTAAGRRFLKDARERLAWMVDPLRRDPEPSHAPLAMALFGMGALASDPLNEPFRRSFSRGEAGGGSGCSGGCGSSSSGGDGGGGDGGGGGCGGCGGGD